MKNIFVILFQRFRIYVCSVCKSKWEQLQCCASCRDCGPVLRQCWLNFWYQRMCWLRLRVFLTLESYSINITHSQPPAKYTYSPRARGVLFVLKGPYDLRVPPIVKFSQESESARLTKIILSKSTVKTL